MSARATLKNAALKTIERRHPWIFSGAIHAVKGNPQDGDIIRLVDSKGNFLARGYWNSQSQIQLRLFSWDDSAEINTDFWQVRIQTALNARQHLLAQPDGACRLINAENDYLPGLIVDRYGDWLVLQALTLGIERRKSLFVEILAELLQPSGIYERSDVDVRAREGLEETTGVLYGEAPPPHIIIQENGLKFAVDLYQGHKTGFYLDQRDNRALLQSTISPDSIVLNAFGYTGGFAIAALAGGAGQAITIDTSESVLDLARENTRHNGFPVQDEDFVQGDVFQVLREYRNQNKQFDAIILDPPKFAHNPRQVKRASRGYKDINLLAFQLLKPGGVLWTFSCSGAISPDLFQKIVFGALIDAGRDASIARFIGAAPDHPTALTFPEGQYLKGLVCRVI